MQAVTKKDIEAKYSKGDQDLQEAPSLQQQAADYLQKEVLAPAEAYSGQSLDQKLQGLTPNYTQARRYLHHICAAGGARTSLIVLPTLPTGHAARNNIRMLWSGQVGNLDRWRLAGLMPDHTHASLVST